MVERRTVTGAGALGMLAALSCAGGSEAGRNASVREGTPGQGVPLPEQGAQTETDSGRPVPEPLPATCLLAGVDADERGGNLLEITSQYFFAHYDACETRALTRAMSLDALADWANYLQNYTHALFGCELLFEPLPGGVAAFGLANTEAVGIPNPIIGAADAQLLIDMYMAACAGQLGASAEALAPIRQHLEQAAARRIVAGVNGALSECEPRP